MHKNEMHILSYVGGMYNYVLQQCNTITSAASLQSIPTALFEVGQSDILDCCIGQGQSNLGDIGTYNILVIASL